MLIFNLEFWVLSNGDISVFTIIVGGQLGEELLFGGGLWRSLVLENRDGWIILLSVDLHAKLSDLFPVNIGNKCFLLVFVNLVLVHIVENFILAGWNVNGGPLGVEELVSVIFEHDISLQGSSVDQLMDDILQALIFFVHVSDECLLELFVMLLNVLVQRDLTFTNDNMGLSQRFDFFVA